EYMQSLITVSNPEDTRLLYITARYHDAEMAADIANAYAKAAKEFVINTMRGDEPSDFSIALVPGYAYITSKSGAIIKGFLLGSVLAIGILTLMFVLDDRPRTPEDIQMYGGIPTLAILPSIKEAKRLSKKRKYGYGKAGRR
ncbi:MAG: polysaccharide export protein, partial [Clostridia bacterium]|nr:polysaccharide export protein [Clostridia bacterium]